MKDGLVLLSILDKKLTLREIVALEQSSVVSAVTLTVFGFTHSTLWLVTNVLVLLVTATAFA
jgi:hypothetical protein